MSVRDEWVANLQAATTAAIDAVANLEPDARAGYEEGLDRLDTLLGYAAVVIDGTQPGLLTPGMYNGLLNELQQIGNNPASIPANAEVWGDTLSEALAKLPLARGHDFAQAARDAAANYQRSTQHRLNGLSAAIENLNTQVQTVRTSASEKATEISAELEAEADGFQSRLDELVSKIDSHAARLESTSTSQSEVFREAQTKRDEVFSTTLREANDSLASQLEEAKAAAADGVAEIRRMEEESSNLVGAVGIAGTADRYGLEVKEQKEAADRWRKATVVFALFAGLFVGVYVLTLDGSPTWEETFGKLSISFLLGGVAAYAARQSARHRQREEQSRRMQLELAAFGPFIEPLTAEQREEERVVMARKTFGRAANPNAPAPDEPGPTPISFLLRRRESKDA